MALHQLYMPEFLEDINHYLYEINHIVIPQFKTTTPTTSSSPLSPTTLLAVEWLRIMISISDILFLTMILDPI